MAFYSRLVKDICGAGFRGFRVFTWSFFRCYLDLTSLRAVHISFSFELGFYKGLVGLVFLRVTKSIPGLAALMRACLDPARANSRDPFLKIREPCWTPVLKRALAPVFIKSGSCRTPFFIRSETIHFPHCPKTWLTALSRALPTFLRTRGIMHGFIEYLSPQWGLVEWLDFVAIFVRRH